MLPQQAATVSGIEISILIFTRQIKVNRRKLPFSRLLPNSRRNPRDETLYCSGLKFRKQSSERVKRPNFAEKVTSPRYLNTATAYGNQMARKIVSLGKFHNHRSLFPPKFQSFHEPNRYVGGCTSWSTKHLQSNNDIHTL